MISIRTDAVRLDGGRSGTIQYALDTAPDATAPHERCTNCTICGGIWFAMSRICMALAIHWYRAAAVNVLHDSVRSMTLFELIMKPCGVVYKTGALPGGYDTLRLLSRTGGFVP